MIILPDRHIVRTKFLMPVPNTQWREPSLAQPKDCFGRANRTMFSIEARTHDNVMLWRGWFDSREDFDAFLWAIATGSLLQERPLWDLPRPMFPGLPLDLVYKFYDWDFYTSPTGSNQTWNRPNDWNANDNVIYMLGGGGSGGISQGTGAVAQGGGGAAYAYTSNFNAASATYQIGGGAAARGPAMASQSGYNGGSSWFNSTTYPGSTLGARYGGLGGTYGSPSGANGGTVGAGSGYAGGRSGTTSNSQNASGGGGAGGPNAAGGNSPNVSGDWNGGAGAQGDGTYGGAAGSAGGGGSGPHGGDGGNGTEFQSSPDYGSGGGGGGCGYIGSGVACIGGNGGNYGAGGGAAASYNSNATSGPGIQGMMAVRYTPKRGGGFGHIGLHL